MENQLSTRSGRRVTAYGFGCGYVEVRLLGEVWTRLYKQHGVYFVRSYDHENNVLLFHEAFTSVRRARAFFNRCRGRLRRNREVIC